MYHPSHTDSGETSIDALNNTGWVCFLPSSSLNHVSLLMKYFGCKIIMYYIDKQGPIEHIDGQYKIKSFSGVKGEIYVNSI